MRNRLGAPRIGYRAHSNTLPDAGTGFYSLPYIIRPAPSPRVCGRAHGNDIDGVVVSIRSLKALLRPILAPHRQHSGRFDHGRH